MINEMFDENEGSDTTPRRARKKRNPVLIIFVLLVVAIVAIGGFYFKMINDALSSVERDPGLLPTEGPSLSAPLPEHDALDILLIGSDSRGADRGRSDVLMLIHISDERDRVDLISIPRDYWVPIPGRRTAKVNAAYSWGGAELSVRTVQDLLGIKIDHVAITDFEGFTNAIDSLGGVNVNNKVASKTKDYNWPAGQIRLASGKEAQVYVRQRYGLAGGDFDRNERQRAVIQGVVNEMTTGGVLTNPILLSESLTKIGSNFRVDEGMSNSMLMKLAGDVALGGAAKNVNSHMAPTAGFGTSSDGQSYVRVDQEALKALGEKLRNDKMS